MKKILLIEDNDDIRTNTAEILELASYKVIVASDGKIGVARAIEERPDLIICDIMMPGLDGYAVLHAIHKNEQIRDTPFIFLTAKSDRNDFRKGMDLGADDYLTKPFTGTELLNSVDGRLKKNESLKEAIHSRLEFVQQMMEANLSKSTLQSLTEDRPVNRYKKKQIIYSEGNHPNRLYYLIEGKVKTYRSNDQGKELVTNIYQSGDFFGYTALLESGPYQDTAKALEDCSLAIIPKEDFEALLNTSPQVAQKLIQLLVNNITEKESFLVNLAYNSLRKKVAEALMRLEGKYNANKGQPFAIDLSRETLANIAGTAKESLIRTLGEFQSEKLIDLSKNGSIRILNPVKLKQIVN